MSNDSKQIALSNKSYPSFPEITTWWFKCKDIIKREYCLLISV